MTAQTETTPAALRELMATEFRATIERLQAETRTDWILAWPSIGLAVKFHQDEPGPQLHITNLESASPIDPAAYISRVTNGHGDEAQRVRRQDAMAAQIANLRELIANLETEEA